MNKSSVLLSWKPPIDDGGSKVESYVVEYREAFNMEWKKAGTCKGTDYDVDGLNKGRSYFFRVSGVNKVGMGAPCSLPEAVLLQSPISEILLDL